MPGTRWCGSGNVSTDGDSYGNILATDRCCQQHDRCPHTIESFSLKYGLFNYRLHTISHCECDDVYVRLSVCLSVCSVIKQVAQLWLILATLCITTNGKIVKQSRDHSQAHFGGNVLSFW